ncbi:MAG TPA: hypothetical protein VMB03_33265 [Bryobacteraceae bacterium]|nr:hypothetical protein [Bryobacteraceae bacterium]
MNARHRTITASLSAAIVSILFVPTAGACGYSLTLQTPLAIRQLRIDPQNPLETATSADLVRDLAAANSSASIVGMWNVQFISMGNTKHNPSIPDGAQLDFGYVVWHNDGTEFMNSGGRPPSVQNFCMGVYAETGRYTYTLTHFALNYNATTGAWVGKTLIAESITLSAGGTKYSGTVTITSFDTNGNQTDQVTGQVSANRITVDTATP